MRTQDRKGSIKKCIAVIESSDDAIFTKSLEGIILSWNTGAQQMYGYSPEEIIGRHVDILVPDGHKGEIVKILDKLRRGGHFRHFETQRVRKDGTIIDVSLSISPVKDNRGNVIEASTIARDITDRKRIENERLRVQNSFLDSLMNLYGILIIRDFDRKILKWNKNLELVTGYTAEEMRSISLDSLVETVSNETRENVERVTREGKDIMIEANFITKAGKKIPFLVHSTRVEYNGTPALMSIGFDISTQKQAMQELEAFSYSVSHDLRAPLRAIDGFSNVLMQKHSQGLDNEAVRYLNIIRSNTVNMGKLIDDLLAFSRAGKSNIQMTQIDMEAMARAVFEEIYSSNKDRKIEFIIKSMPKCLSDSDMMKIVLTNLISNAVKYTGTRDKAVIEFEGKMTENEVLYSIRDNGIGFDMKYADKLFGVFQRLHSQAEFEGTGIGLALVRRIITRHGGNVWAESKPDEGSVFYFSLPSEKGGRNG